MLVSILPWKWLSAFEGAVFVATVVVILLAYRWFSWRIKLLPPGPMGLPIVGYLPFVGKAPYLTFDQLRFKYGPVFSLYMGSTLVVVLGNLKAIKEAFSQDAFLDRPVDNAFNIQEDITGFGQISGPVWREQRKFALHVLRDLGFGKRSMEDQINVEIAELLKYLSKQKGSPLDPSRVLLFSISNNVTALVYGKRFEYDDPAMLFLADSFERSSNFLAQTSIHAFFPWLKKFLFRFNLLGYGNLEEIFEKGQNFNTEIINAHKETLDPNNPRDYIDRFLTEMNALDAKGERHSFTKSMLLGNIGLLFGAGTDTIRNTIRWSLLLMASHPDIQTRLQREIDSVLGSEKHLRWSDHSSLPYVQAVLLEVQRWVTLVPINSARCTNADAVVQSFNIPKGTVVLANLWGTHHDPATWKAPHLFNPERFLDGENKIVKTEALIPFSFGKRSCPGEALANVEAFLYFVSILRRFTVKLPEGSGKPDFGGILGITLQPKPHELRFVERTC